MQNKILYIKAEQNSEVLNKNIYLSDIVKLYGVDKNMVKKLNQTLFMKVNEKNNTKYVVSILKVIELIEKNYPDVQVVNLGEADFIIQYKVPSKPKQWLEYTKVVLLCLVVFFGAVFSIMTFNTDVSVGDVFDNMYQLVLGKEYDGLGVLEISYALGLPIGSIIFFNHYKRWQRKDDPTPLEIAMRSYEEDEYKAIIKEAEREGKTMDAD